MRGDLRVVQGGAAPVPPVVADPGRFQEDCAQAYAASWVARGFSQVTVDSATSGWSGRCRRWGAAWEVTREDIDRVVGSGRGGPRGLDPAGVRADLQGFPRFLHARKAGEIEAVFGVRLVCPVDEFNASRHVAMHRRCSAPPSPERLAEFFEFLKVGSRPPASSARRRATMRCSGRFITRVAVGGGCAAGAPDVHFGRGPFGKLHVRFGKAAHTSGPRPRWVPMLDGLDLVLRWFLADVRTGSRTPRCCSATSPAARCTVGRSATGCGT